MNLAELRNPEDIRDFKKKFDDKDTAKPIYRNPQWKADLDEKMEKHGFYILGAGVSGAVYKHPNYPLVLKVFKKDSGYITWFKFCKENQHNKYVPKIRGSLIRINKMFWAARLEYLKRAHAIYHISSLNMLSTIKSLIQHPEDIENNEYDLDLIDIVNFLSEHRDSLDLHAGNIMIRENNEMVIIDPLYSGD